MEEKPPTSAPAGGEGKNFDHLVADAAHHVLERYDAQAVAEKPAAPRSQKPLLIVLLIIFLGVVGWNVYYFGRMGRMSSELEETYLQTTIYLTALTLDAEFEATGAYPRDLTEVGMDEEGMTYVRAGDGYTLRIEGERATLEYSSGEDLAPFREAFQRQQRGEMPR